AYKNIDEVIHVSHAGGLSRPIIKFTPLGNIKG
ncbi:MAG TPA: hypothetical protein DCS07_04130, partial [Bdellovibrionales bacterium]|nr:hypothetical protein [Bdellovibrionales bacterium]